EIPTDDLTPRGMQNKAGASKEAAWDEGSHASWPKVRVVEKLDPLPTDPTDPPVGGAPAWEVGKVYNSGDKV
ncbi:hypothetical protein, partial [Vibrio cholerae]|uniref:hypothetical protein n=1 Tax=Vibrio cholerae TaxID=666 RepID=UPI001124E3E7